MSDAGCNNCRGRPWKSDVGRWNRGPTPELWGRTRVFAQDRHLCV